MLNIGNPFTEVFRAWQNCPQQFWTLLHGTQYRETQHSLALHRTVVDSSGLDLFLLLSSYMVKMHVYMVNLPCIHAFLPCKNLEEGINLVQNCPRQFCEAPNCVEFLDTACHEGESRTVVDSSVKREKLLWTGFQYSAYQWVVIVDFLTLENAMYFTMYDFLTLENTMYFYHVWFPYFRKRHVRLLHGKIVLTLEIYHVYMHFYHVYYTW